MLALWGAPLAAAEPDVQPAPAAETITLPVTLGAFRAAFPAGTTLRFRMETAGEPTVVMRWQWTAVDAEGGTRHTWIYAEDGTTVLQDAGDARDVWTELMAHATFPKAGTVVTDGKAEVPGGTFDTTVVTVTTVEPGGPTTVETYHFAKRLPGPPVLYTTEVDGTMASRMTLLERSVQPAGLAVTDTPEAAALAQKVAARTGNPYREKGLRFTFVTGTVRRTHRWDIPGNRAEVSWTDKEGRACRATVPMGYAGDDPLLQTAWSAFVNDQFWLLAPAKVLDPGVIRTADGTDLRLFYAGVGLTPGDRYLLHTAPDGDVLGWEYVLQSGRGATWTWAAPTKVGGLRLSLRRESPERTITFEDVAAGRQPLSAAPPACTAPAPAP